MKVFKKDGKYGVKSNNKIIVNPIYSTAFEMVSKDPFFVRNTESLKPVATSKESVGKEN